MKKLIDKWGLIYYLIKKDNEYYLTIKKTNPNTKKTRLSALIKGERNIRIFIKNNKLVKCDE